MSTEATGSGALEFWLTRFKPGWNDDGVRYDWPDFHLDLHFVTVRKEIDPCRLCFRVEGVSANPVELVGPCPELIDAPRGMRGVHVRLEWGRGTIALWLNGQRVADAPVG